MRAISRRGGCRRTRGFGLLPLLSLCAAVEVTALVVPKPTARAEAGAAVGSPAEVENVRAFARLFGVVRFFYPGDACTEIDWGRFAVHGVAQARTARDSRALAATLQSLVAPLGPGIVVGARLPEAATPVAGGPLVAWQYLGAGFSALPGPYRARRTNRAATASIDGFVTVMRNVPAEALRGRAIRLRGEARVRASDESGTGALWLRVDRPNQAMGFFDTMQDRPIREAAWREYTIEGTVAEDAANVAFGVMASGAATADFDAIALSTRGADGTWAAVPLTDDGFEASADGGQSAGWFRAGTSREAIEKRVGDDPFEGRQCLRLAPGTAAGGPLFDAPLTAGDHVDVDLGSGLHARVPLTLGDAEARIGPAQRASLDALKAALAALPIPAGDPGLDLRLADVVVAWNVYRHFYPYWPETGVDWDARLPALLDAAARTTTRDAHTIALKALVAEVRDGHGFVAAPKDKPSAPLPMRLALVEDRLVVTASAEPAVPVGAVLLQIDGVPAVKAIERLLALSSGTLQWRRARAVREVGGGAPDSEARLRIDDGREVRELAVRRRAAEPPPERRPEPVTELEPGIFYVDLTRATRSQLDQAMAGLAGARGVVFDMRGYPTETGAQILPHLIDAPETDRWMHVARITGPFGRAASWESAGWNLQPAPPHLAGRRVFLTDGRAISYAESVMGYVGDRKLGTVVGSTTAGTNGNVATFDLPSGSRIGFTAMRVTGHDGRAPHHLVGVRPDVPAEPTVAGIRAGRDEVLERGLALARTP